MRLLKKGFRAWLASLPPDEPLPSDPEEYANCPLERWLWAEHGWPRPFVGNGHGIYPDGNTADFVKAPPWLPRFVGEIDARGTRSWDWPAARVLAVLDGKE